MKKILNILVVMCFIWYSIYIPGDMPLIQGRGINSIETILWILFLLIVLFYFSGEKNANLFLILFLGMLLLVEFNTIIKFVFLNYREDIILKYNNLYGGTIYLFKPSLNYLVPNLYHTILIILTVLTFTLTIINSMHKIVKKRYGY